MDLARYLVDVIEDILDHEIGASWPRAREDRRLAADHFPRRAALRGIWFHPRNEPPQCRSDVHDAAHRNGDSPNDYQRHRGYHVLLSEVRVPTADGQTTERYHDNEGCGNGKQMRECKANGVLNRQPLSGRSWFQRHLGRLAQRRNSHRRA
jgi:hypothetical protein